MKYVQVNLFEINSNRNLICWIEKDSRVKKGKIITLKNQEGRWRVDNIYSEIEKELDELHQDWKVGGL